MHPRHVLIFQAKIGQTGVVPYNEKKLTWVGIIIFGGLLENEQKIVISRFNIGGFTRDYLLQ